MAKKKKITKTAAEYDRIMKQIKSQERYYKKKGISITEVSAADFGGKTRSGLAQIRKYQKQLKQEVKNIQKKVKGLAKDLGISTKAAYEIVSSEYGGQIPTYYQVAIDNFYRIVGSWATRSSREAMYRFLNEVRSRKVSDEDFGRALKETTDQDAAMEELQEYHKLPEEQAILQPLLFNILNRLSELASLGKDEIKDKFAEIIGGNYKAR